MATGGGSGGRVSVHKTNEKLPYIYIHYIYETKNLQLDWNCKGPCMHQRYSQTLSAATSVGGGEVDRSEAKNKNKDATASLPGETTRNGTERAQNRSISSEAEGSKATRSTSEQSEAE